VPQRLWLPSILVLVPIDGSNTIPEPALLISFDEEAVLESAVRIGLVILVALVAVLLLQRILNPLVRVAVREQMEKEPETEVEKRISTLSHVIYRTLLVVVMAVALVTILPEFGINAAALIAGLGLFGLAVGFGAQNLVKDIINGTFILVENQYGVGDVITIAGITGVVEDLNLRRTILRDLDGTVHSISHGQIDTTSNWTKSYSRVNLNVGVSYSSNLDHVIQVINHVGQELADDPEFKARIIDPPHVLRVDGFGDSSIDIKIIGETAPIEQWGIMGELRLRLKKAFDEEGIEIPFPQRTVHMAPAEPASRGRQSTPVEAQHGGGRPDDPRLDDGD
jgi:small conductance mechanosensitive channel